MLQVVKLYNAMIGTLELANMKFVIFVMEENVYVLSVFRFVHESKNSMKLERQQISLYVWIPKLFNSDILLQQFMFKNIAGNLLVNLEIVFYK